MNLNTDYPKQTILGTTVTDETFRRIVKEIDDKLTQVPYSQRLAVSQTIAARVVFKHTWPEVLAALVLSLLFPVLSYLMYHAALSLAWVPTLPMA